MKMTREKNVDDKTGPEPVEIKTGCFPCLMPWHANIIHRVGKMIMINMWVQPYFIYDITLFKYTFRVTWNHYGESKHSAQLK